MEKLKKEKIKTSVMLAIILALLALCAFMGVQALTNSKTTNFNLGTTFEPEVLVEVKMGIDSNSDNTIFDSEFVSIFNSADPNGVDYTAYYIESITDDTLNLKNETLVTTNGNVELKIINYDTEAKLRCYINNTTTITVAKATANISPEQNQTIAVGTPTLGAVLISLRFESVTSAIVTYNTNGGSIIANSVVPIDSQLTLPVPPSKSGLAFAGWYINAGLTQEFVETTLISEDITLYAKWAEVWDGSSNTSWYNSSLSTFQISNGAQLAGLASLVNSGTNFSGKTIQLTQDIYLNEGIISSTGSSSGTTHPWLSIGKSSKWFKGVFDGKGYEVSGVYIVDSPEYMYGLFGYCVDGTVQNLTVKNGYVTGQYAAGIVGAASSGCSIINCINMVNVAGSSRVGGICGMNSGDIINCTNYGSISGSGEYIGGICGANGVPGDGEGGVIDSCVNFGTITGGDYVGGVSGDSYFGKFFNCGNRGNVVNFSSCIGGIVGTFYFANIFNCYNTGSISGVSYVGGIAGILSAPNGNPYNLYNCYNIGEITGDQNIGGICGTNDTSTLVHSCYAIQAISGSGTNGVENCYQITNSGGVLIANGSDVKDLLNAWVASPTVAAPTGVTYKNWGYLNGLLVFAS